MPLLSARLCGEGWLIEVQKGDTMKKQWLLLVALGVLLVGSAIAQNDFTQRMVGSVPFDFFVNGTTFPRGEYVVSAPSDGHRFLLQNKAKPEYGTFVLNTDIALGANRIHAENKLIFVRTNGQHVLHQICLAGDSHTHDMIHGSEVIELVATR